LGKLHFGGYGEMHANFIQGSESDQADLHRLVLYLGYDFTDWIRFNSETEVEHAYITDGDGEISLEQAYVDFLLTGKFNVRVGRILTPIGIINKKHEPPTFNGVERPAFATNIIHISICLYTNTVSFKCQLLVRRIFPGNSAGQLQTFKPLTPLGLRSRPRTPLRTVHEIDSRIWGPSVW